MSKNISSGSRWQLPLVCVTAMLISLLGAAPASAAPAAPGGLSPSTSVASSTPVLSWRRSAGAVRYDVQVASNSAFTSTLFSASTTNRRATPTTVLPDGNLYWRVRGVASSGAAGSWSQRAFTITKTDGPTLIPPPGGAELKQPDNPPLLSWTAVQGATAYEIELDTDPDFVQATPYTTKTTSYVVPDTKSGGTYYWRVRAQRANGIFTHWSDPSSYRIGSLSEVTTTSPVDDANDSLEDVVLDWDPVPGASSYEIWVSTDQEFNTDVDRKTVKGTRYSPPTTYLNNQYYWKVRAKNLQGETIDWPSVQRHNFRRNWPDTPTPQHPVNINGTTDPATGEYPPPGPAFGDDFYFQWTPVQHATRYQLVVGTDPNFSPSTFKTCEIVGTTYAAGYRINPADACMPSQGSLYFWKVRAIDDPSAVQGIYSDVNAFVYDSGIVNQVTPVSGFVAVPTLEWEASQDAERYRVIVTDATGRTVAQTDTYALSWTPTGSALDSTKGPFAWTVQAIDANGSVSPKYAGSTFSLAGAPATSSAAPLTPLTGLTTDAPTNRFPNLTWEPMDGAKYYRVKIGNSGAGGAGYWFPTSHAPILNATFPYPAATDTGKTIMSPGLYDWQVEAFSSTGQKLGEGSIGTFRIVDIAPVVAQQIALNGTSLDQGLACDAFLDDPSGDPEICSSVPTTPVLDWAPVPDASHYMIYLAQDREFTNMVYTTIPETVNTRWTPAWLASPYKALPDSQAGTAYYWFVRPCKAVNVCAPDPISTDKAATNAFDKQSPAVSLVSPAAGTDANPTIVTDGEITFSWEDYLATNRAKTFPATQEPSTQTAKQYRLQVSTSPTFSTLVEGGSVGVTVDQTTYTPYGVTYPEGNLYWRVQALDGHGNGLTWSSTRKVVKASPPPDLLSPVGSDPTLGDSPFRWKPTNFAGSYRLEVYKNDDTAFSTVNRVVSYTSKQTAYSYSSPLPASPEPYVWRLQRLDVDGRPGAWSSTGRFISRGAPPELDSPSSRSYVSAGDALFTWKAVTGAVTYRFERKLSTASNATETVTTSGTSWAPTAAMTHGSWMWRVTSLDVNRNVLGTSGWRRFSVDTTKPRVVRKSPTRTAARSANFVAAFSERVYAVSSRTVKLYVKGKRTSVSARVTLSADRRTAKLNPKRNLTKGKVYTLRLSNGIADKAGNHLTARSWKVKAK